MKSFFASAMAVVPAASPLPYTIPATKGNPPPLP